MSRIPPFESNQLEALCRLLADTNRGLSGSEIGHLLAQLYIPDTDPLLTKRKRLFNALANDQNLQSCGTNVCRFIEKAMDPVRYVGKEEEFEERRDSLNIVIAFLGYSLGADGKLRLAEQARTLSEAEKRADRLRRELVYRRVHPDILEVCRARFLKKDCFYCVLEATKSIAEKIREKSGLGTDGMILIDQALEKGNHEFPLLAFNSLQTDTERNEHRGLVNLARGLIGSFRNPTAHEPEHKWPIDEQDAADLLTMASFIHRRLDEVVRTRQTEHSRL